MSERNVTPGFPFRINVKMAILVAAAALLGLTAFTSVYIVDATEEAVILTLGKVSRTEGPGLRFKAPFGIEENFNVPTKRNIAVNFGTARGNNMPTLDEKTESMMLTGDKNIIEVLWSIQYTIVDAKKWLFNLDPSAREATIRDIAQTALNQVVGDSGVFEVFADRRKEVQAETLKLMDEIFARYDVGIKVNTVQLGNVAVPRSDVQDAFSDVLRAGQERIQRINEGQELFNKEIPNAKGQALQKIQEAEGYKAERVNRAKGEAARFLAVLGEYRKSPEVTRTRLYFEMVDSVFKDQKNVDLVDKKLEGFLPLKNLGAGVPR